MCVTDGRMHVKTIKNIELLHGSRSVNEYGAIATNVQARRRVLFYALYKEIFECIRRILRV